MAVLDALRADREALVEIAWGLGPSDWRAPSGCPGWSVQDVVAHMGALYWMVADPSVLPDTGGLDTERAQDLIVASRRGWETARVVDDYLKASDQALEVLAGLAEADAEIPLGDLGTYPARLIPNAYAFDHFTHIRADLFPPRGPLGGEAPAAEEEGVAATLDWIEAAAPQQNADLVARIPGTAELVVEGPGGRRITLGVGPARATVTSDALAFVRWATQRGSWQELGVETSGDPAVLDAVRGLHVI